MVLVSSNDISYSTGVLNSITSPTFLLVATAVYLKPWQVFDLEVKDQQLSQVERKFTRRVH